MKPELAILIGASRLHQALRTNHTDPPVAVWDLIHRYDLTVHLDRSAVDILCHPDIDLKGIVAVEQGAKGPDKDCGYEGPFLKAISGIPISMEGKTAACAHLSPVGNVAAACTDLWSNESVQNVKLLAGMAPTVYLEQLEYDARLMNQAIKGGKESVLGLQKLFVDSDTYYDPQAFILAPKNVIEISKEIVSGENYVDSTRKACLKGIDLIENAIEDGVLMRDEKEDEWIKMLKEDISSIPDNESDFMEQVLPTIDQSKIILSEYGLT